MKIVGLDFYIGNVERIDALGLDMDHPILVLQRSSDAYEMAARYYDPILFEGIGRENNIGDSGFVFEREKDKTLCGSRTLAGDDAARNAYKTVVR